MSIIGKIEGAVGGVISAGEDVVGLAKKVWDAFKSLWWLLDHAALLLTDAWDWMVKGAEYIGVGMEHLISQTGGAIWDLVTHDLPALASWVYRNAIAWAWHEITALAGAVEHRVLGVIHWAGHELHRLEQLILGWVKSLIRWAEGAVRWVERFGGIVWHLISHPLVLAELLADYIVWPVVKWFLRAGAHIVVYLLKRAATQGSEVEHLFEDVLHDLL